MTFLVLMSGHLRQFTCWMDLIHVDLVEKCRCMKVSDGLLNAWEFIDFVYGLP